MLARDLYRNQPDRIREMLTHRGTTAPLDRLLEVDDAWREVLVEVEDLKARRNAGSKSRRRGLKGRSIRSCARSPISC